MLQFNYDDKNDTDNNKFCNDLFSSIEVDIMLGRLSPIERRVIELMSEGLSNRKIAIELKTSRSNVSNKIKSAKNKIISILP